MDIDRIFGYGDVYSDKGYPGFQLLSDYHIISLIIIIAIYIIVPLIMSKQSKSAKNSFRIGLGIFMLFNYAIHQVWHYIVNPPEVATEILGRLPMHLCAISSILIAIVLITNNYRLFEIAYFWAIGGGLISILTPDTAYAFPHFEFIQTQIHHSFLILAAIYMSVVMKHRITFRSYAKSALALNIYLIVILLFNFTYGTNYMYINETPDFYTFAHDLEQIFGSWPNYLIGFELTGWVIYGIAYIPFGIINYRQSEDKRRRLRELIIAIYAFFAAASSILVGVFFTSILSLYMMMIVAIGIAGVLLTQNNHDRDLGLDT